MTSRWRQPKRLATAEAVRRAASAPGLAGEGVGAAGVDHQGAHVLAAAWRVQLAPAPVHRGRADLWRVKTPAQVVPSAKRNDHQVVALVLVEAGAGGGDLDPADRRNGREGHGQGRDRRGRACRAAAAAATGCAARVGALEGRGQGIEGLFDRVFDRPCRSSRASGSLTGRRLRRRGGGGRRRDRRCGRSRGRGRRGASAVGLGAARRSGRGRLLGRAAVGGQQDVDLGLAAQLLQQLAHAFVGQEAHDLRPGLLQRRRAFAAAVLDPQHGPAALGLERADGRAGRRRRAGRLA